MSRKRIYPDKGESSGKKSRFSLNPIHHHAGPFNTVDDVKSSDPVDEAARVHDIMYGNAQTRHGFLSPYIRPGLADDIFVDEELASNTVAGAIYALPFIAKSNIASMLGIDPIPSNSFLSPLVDKPDSFGKVAMNRYNGRRFKRRGGVKRRRRVSKPIKRLSKLAIYKTIGKSVEQKIASYANCVGAFNTENPMTTLSSNNEYIIHACTLNDFFQYQDMANCNAGPAGSEDMDISYLAGNFGAYYMTKCMAELEISSFCNVDLVLQPIKITLKWDLANDYNSSIVDENLVAYNVFSQLRYLATGYMDPTDIPLLPVPVVPVAANYLPTSLQYPSGMQLPWKLWKRNFDIEMGTEFLLPAGKSAHKLMCKGKKGFMPKEQFWQSSPGSGIGSVTNPRQVVGFGKKTSIYCLRVRQKSHVYSSKFATLDNREAYLGGPFRFVMNILKTTSAVNMPTTAQEQKFTTFRDNRPQADNTTTAATALAWADADDVAGAVVVTA